MSDAPVAVPETDAPAAPGATFAELPLRPELQSALAALGYEEPTPIQREAIGPLVEGRDLLGQAATGTGKTAAFALPLLQRLAERPHGFKSTGAPTALVLVPTRELAVQVSEAIHKYGKALGARVLPIYGGQPIVRQLKALKAGVDVVVATPGRALDHVGRGTLKPEALAIVVLDEADEMLDMGFAEDIESILSATPEGRQTVLFSATMPPRINGIAKRHLTDPVRVVMGREATAAGEAPLVRETAYVVARAHKPAALTRLLDVEAPTAAIVFCRTRDDVDRLTETLNGRGYRAEALHGGVSQEGRDRVMARLRAGTSELLIATDVAARGLDVDQLTHVFNYDVPAAPESYVHRIGRVGRAGREGVAVTLAEPREHRGLKMIERITGRPIRVERVPTVADMRARRLEGTRAALAAKLADADFDRFRVVVETLADEWDVMDVAAAAVALAHDAAGVAEADEHEIPDAPRPEKRGDKPWDKKGKPGPRRDDAAGKPGPYRRPTVDTTKVFIGAGAAGKVRPQDLVGAICGETSLQGRDIGAIEISDRFSLVEVPSDKADEVIGALRASTIKGRKTEVRREKFQTKKPR